MTDHDDVLLTEQHGHTLLLTINRPEARNALNGAVARAMAAALDRLDEDDDLRVGVLTGAGGTFSSGMDLKGFLTGDLPHVEGRGLAGLTERPPRKPLIAAIEGYALAGGCELVLACDLVVAAEDAKLGVPEVKRGLVAAGGAAMLLAQRIPRAAALELLLVGDPVGAQRAHELGLVNRVVPSGTAVEAALELAARIGDNGPLAVAVSKQVALEAADWSWEEGWGKQMELIAPVFVSADAQEGATAFAEKRPPNWTGR
jgi:enoyl-CoA hydratase